jgi:hypothetical protein
MDWPDQNTSNRWAIRPKQTNMDVFFSHENRVLNVDAHNLARGASSLQEGPYIWLLNTPDITCIPLVIIYN